MNYLNSNEYSRPAKSVGILYTNRGDDAMVILYCAIHLLTELKLLSVFL